MSQHKSHFPYARRPTQANQVRSALMTAHIQEEKVFACTSICKLDQQYVREDRNRAHCS